MNGLLLVDKEKGFSSFDEIRRARKLSGERKIGHGGTLDPLATGLLILGFNKATKLLGKMLGMDKEYEVAAHFGAVSDSYDADGKIEKIYAGAEIGKEEILNSIRENFLGEITQFPPKYSALKIKGKRACDIMRAGGTVEVKSRQVKIYDFDLKSFVWPRATFLIKCGSGTYVRSLIHDLGQVLKCGAYVEELRRTKVGNFDVKNAVRLSDIKQIEECDLITI